MQHDIGVLAERERRGRLAAEKMLALRERDLKGRIARLEETSRRLSHEIEAKRREAARLARSSEDAERARADLSRRMEEVRSEAEATEASLWAALQTIRDGFAIFDAEGRLVLANQAYLSIFDGIDEVEPGVSYARLCSILAEEGIVDAGDDPRAWQAAMVGRWQQEVIPSEVLHLWNGQFVKLVDRRLETGGVVTLGINQTETMRSLAAIEALPDGFVLYDGDDRLVTCNEAYRAAYPLSAHAMVPGAEFADILRAGLAAGEYAEALGREEEWLEERLDRHLSGVQAPIEQRLSSGRWLRVLETELPDGSRAGVRVDITPFKEQQIELERLAEAARAATRAKSAFLSNMSHEIRTPMNGLVGMAEGLLGTDLTPEQADMAGTLRRSAEGLLRLLDDVLSFSQAEAGQLELRPEPVCMRTLLREMAEGFSARAASRGLALTTEIAPEVPDRVMADPARLRQMMVNLLGNAMKFTEAGHVAVRCRAKGREICISVEDTGPGVPEDRRAQIFDGFAQGEDGAARGHDGAGLGLAICRRIMDLAGGHMSHRPRRGGGSVFEARFPAPLAPAETGRSAATERTVAPMNLRIVAAEDNATNRFVLEKLLAPLGVELRLVESAKACIEAVTGDPPDLVLTDISMPDMDGREMTRRLRAWEMRAGRSPLRIVAMTAHSLPGDIEDILAAGLDRVLTKPLKRDLLAEECALAAAGGRRRS